MKNTYPLRFTVAICSYNIEKYIERAIKSVLNQDYENYEVIVVDDCSQDNTVEIIKKYESNKLKFFSTEKNSGTAAASRNISIEKARLTCDVTFSVSSRCWKREFLIKNNMKFVTGMYYEDELYSLKGTILAQNTKSANIKVFKYYRNREGSVMTAPSIKKCSDWYRMLAEVMDLYQITPNEYKPYLLSFIKNENDSIPERIKGILQALDNGGPIKLMPKRDYEYMDFFENS